MINLVKVVPNIRLCDVRGESDGNAIFEASTQTVYVKNGDTLSAISTIKGDSGYIEHHDIPQNCKNCGAPLHSHECEYCGTRY